MSHLQWYEAHKEAHRLNDMRIPKITEQEAWTKEDHKEFMRRQTAALGNADVAAPFVHISEIVEVTDLSASQNPDLTDRRTGSEVVGASIADGTCVLHRGMSMQT